MSQLAFLLSCILILGCLLLCLQKQKRVVPFLRQTSRWGIGVPIVSGVATLGILYTFGIAFALESVVILFALIFGISTVFYFLIRLSS